MIKMQHTKILEMIRNTKYPNNKNNNTIPQNTKHKNSKMIKKYQAMVKY